MSLRVAIIGGLERSSVLWERAGAELGVEVEHHSGLTRGRRVDEIGAAVRRCDLVIIITNPNSHGGVAAARRAALAAGRPHVLLERLRPKALARALAPLAA